MRRPSDIILSHRIVSRVCVSCPASRISILSIVARRKVLVCRSDVSPEAERMLGELVLARLAQTSVKISVEPVRLLFFTSTRLDCQFPWELPVPSG